MMRRAWLCAALVCVLGAGLALGQDEIQPRRFEISVAAGGFDNMGSGEPSGFTDYSPFAPTVLSGPDLQDNSNYVLRFGFMPSENFQLYIGWDHWDAVIAPDDVLNSVFAEVYRTSVNSATNFNDALLDDATIELDQYEVGLVKSIPLGASKHWEIFIGVGLGLQDAVSDIQWTGATKRLEDNSLVPVDAELPSDLSEDSSEFFFSVRGGVNWVPVDWFFLQSELHVLPIDEIYDESLNTMEFNIGFGFRFGKM